MKACGFKTRIAVGLLLIGLTIWQLAFRATISSHMDAFMPASGNDEYALLMEELKRGVGSRLILVAIESAAAEELVAVSRELGACLSESGFFIEVFNGSTPMTKDARDLLFRYRYLLNPQIADSSFSVASLTQALEKRLVEMSSSLSMLQKSTLRSDPTAAFADLLRSWRAGADTMNLDQGIWLSPERDSAFMLLRTRALGTDLDAHEQALMSVREVFDEIRDGRSLVLTISGAPAIAVATRDRIRSEAFGLSIAATLFMVAFLVLVYRELRVVALTLLPLASGVLVASAVVSASYGLLHGITVAFGVTLLGVAVDYPVHLFSHRRPGESGTTCIDRIWPTMRLGMLTTVLGYAAMTLTPIVGLSQMGAFTCVGLIVAAGVTRLVLPALLGTRTEQIRSLARMPAWLTRVPPRGAHAIGLSVGALALGVLLTTQQPWSRDLTDLSPVPAAETELDGGLRARMGAPDTRYLVLVQADSADGVLRRQEELLPVLRRAVERGEVAAFQMAGRYLPSLQTQQRRQQVLPDETALRERMAAASAGLPFKADAFGPFVNDVVASKVMHPLDWDTFRRSGPRLALDELLHATAHGWLGIVHLVGVAQPGRLALRFRDVSVGTARFVDLKREMGALVDGFRVETLRRVGWAVLAVVLVLAVALRDVHRTLRVVGPMLAAVAVAAAVSLMSGAQLNLFHLVSLMLVAGITLDYGLFFTRPGLGSDEFLATLHAVLVCAVSTSAVFALLVFSSIPVLHAIGVVVSSGVVTGFLFTWAFSRGSNAFGERSSRSSKATVIGNDTQRFDGEDHSAD